MQNPFDQFDVNQVEQNPFDAFDQEASEDPAQQVQSVFQPVPSEGPVLRPEQGLPGFEPVPAGGPVSDEFTRDPQSFLPSEFARPVGPDLGFLDATGNAFGRGVQNLQDAVSMLNAEIGNYLGVEGTNERLAQDIAINDEDRRAFPVDRTTQLGQEELETTDGFLDATGAFLSNPRLISNVAAESAPLSAPTLLGAGAVAAAGAGTAPVVGVTALGSFLVEYFSSLSGDVKEAQTGEQILGILNNEKISDEQAIEAIMSDEETMSGFRQFAATRGVPIAALDALTLGTAGKFFGPVRKLVAGSGRSLAGRAAGVGAGTAAELGAQMAGGSAGEALAQRLSEGEISSPAEVVAEGIAEIATAPADVAINSISEARNTRAETARLSSEEDARLKLAEADEAERAATESVAVLQPETLQQPQEALEDATTAEAVPEASPEPVIQGTAPVAPNEQQEPQAIEQAFPLPDPEVAAPPSVEAGTASPIEGAPQAAPELSAPDRAAPPQAEQQAPTEPESIPEAIEAGPESDVISSASNISSLADRIAKHAPRPEHRVIARRIHKRIAELKEDGQKFSLRRYRTLKSLPADMKFGGVQGQARTSFKNDGNVKSELRLNGLGKGLTYETALHELVHLVTSSVTAVGQHASTREGALSKEIAGRLNEIYDATLEAAIRIDSAKDTPTPDFVRSALNGIGRPLTDGETAKTSSNALESVDEILAWGLTNPGMQELMAKTKMPGTNETLWTRFVQTVAKALGISEKDGNTALSELLKVTDDILSADPKEFRKDRGDLINTLTSEQRDGDSQQGSVRNEEASAPIEDFVEGSHKTGTPKPAPQDKLYSNPVEPLGRMLFGSVDEWNAHLKGTAEVRRAIGDYLKGKGFGGRFRMVKEVTHSYDGLMRTLARGFKSPTVDKVLDKFFASSGVAADASRTFDEAFSGEVNRGHNKLDKILDPVADRAGEVNPDVQKRIIDLVQNPGRILPNGPPIHQAAAGLRDFLSERLDYMRKADVDIGEIAEGYWPREFDVNSLIQDRDKFIAQATQVYKITNPEWKDTEAGNAAVSLYDEVVFGGLGAPGQSNASGGVPFVKERKWDKAADEIMSEFYVDNIQALMGQYIVRSSRRAEIARRFGDNWAEWHGLMDDVRSEGAEQMIEPLMDYANMMVGNAHAGFSPSWRQAAGAVRMWTTFGVMEKATLASLAEVFTPALRTGNAADALRALKGTMKSLVAHHRGKPNEMVELAEDLGVISGVGSASLMGSRFAGGDPVTSGQAKAMASYFRRTYLEQWTNATRVASMGVGTVFIRRLAKEFNAGKHKKQFFLSELGIDNADAARFSSWVEGLGDRAPTMSDIQAAGDVGQMYQTAVMRFTDQTIMRPSAATRPRWASHPLGAVVFQLQAFIYAFHKNILGRTARVLRSAKRGEIDKVEAGKLIASQAFIGYPLIYLAQLGIGEMRDELFSDPERRERETTGARLEKAWSRSGYFGAFDFGYNILSGARYQRSITEASMGPALGGIGDALDTSIALLVQNTETTNTQERKAAREVYDFIVEPTVNLGLSMVPVSPASAAVTIGVMPGLRETFVDRMAGRARTRRSNQPIKGLFERFLESEPATARSRRSTRPPARETGRTSR